MKEYFSQAMESTVLLFLNGFSIFILKVCSAGLFERGKQFSSAVAERDSFSAYLELYLHSPATCLFWKSLLNRHAICMWTMFAILILEFFSKINIPVTRNM